MAKMSAPQRAYALAKAAHETAHAEYKRRATSLPDLGTEPTDTEIEAYVDADLAIRRELGVDNFFDILCEAESNMVEWCKQTVTSLPQYRTHASTLAPLWDKWERFPSIREKLIDLAFRLAA